MKVFFSLLDKEDREVKGGENGTGTSTPLRQISRRFLPLLRFSSPNRTLNTGTVGSRKEGRRLGMVWWRVVAMASCRLAE